MVKLLVTIELHDVVRYFDEARKLDAPLLYLALNFEGALTQ